MEAEHEAPSLVPNMDDEGYIVVTKLDRVVDCWSPTTYLTKLHLQRADFAITHGLCSYKDTIRLPIRGEIRAIVEPGELYPSFGVKRKLLPVHFLTSFGGRIACEDVGWR
jgi:hypothetical protein